MTAPASDLLQLFRTLQQLKRTKRTGWLDRGIPPDETESVADHTLMTALIAWFMALDDPDLDADRVLKLAVIHDLAEAIAGDRPPYEPHEIPKDDPEALRAFFSVRRVASPEAQAEKHQAEMEAAKEIFGHLPDSTRGEVRSLWEEYEARSTPEARFVKDVDRLEAFLQARAYQREHPDVPLSGFTDMALNGLEHAPLRAIRDEELGRE
ncbi:MAG TPA: HD domain-containing protein [Thermomicrobiales bacterium]|nr:HD domain-containing protein [Thermomicrobiales bacterium]